MQNQIKPKFYWQFHKPKQIKLSNQKAKPNLQFQFYFILVFQFELNNQHPYPQVPAWSAMMNTLTLHNWHMDS